jgi:hypothetical protein
MNEAETRAEHIDPALKAAGWGGVEGSRIHREYSITPGRGVGLENLRLAPFQHAIQTQQDRQRQDDILVLAAFERVANEVRHTP